MGREKSSHIINMGGSREDAFHTGSIVAAIQKMNLFLFFATNYYLSTNFSLRIEGGYSGGYESERKERLSILCRY